MSYFFHFVKLAEEERAGLRQADTRVHYPRAAARGRAMLLSLQHGDGRRALPGRQLLPASPDPTERRWVRSHSAFSFPALP